MRKPTKPYRMPFGPHSPRMRPTARMGLGATCSLSLESSAVALVGCGSGQVSADLAGVHMSGAAGLTRQAPFPFARRNPQRAQLWHLWMRLRAGIAQRAAGGGGTSLRYCEILSSDSSVPICWKVVTIWSDEVSRKNLSGELAQFCSSVEVGSWVVLT